MLRVFQSSLVSLQHEGLQMTSAARKAGMSMALAVGLLLLAGIGVDGRPALAQIECPLPDGVTPLAAPGVTAQQVEDGSASLADFALAVRDVFVSESQGMVTSNITTLTELSYVGCLFRREEGPWRSGSTYVVRLIPSDRVFIHANDMSLSGHRLDPVIYEAVLRAVGIDPAELTSRAASVDAFAAAATRNGGEFNVPDIPGASGYAFGLLSGIAGTPVVMLAGFDLDASHLAEEEIEHIDPPVTAREVVDRESLKAFVTAAGEYFVGLLGSGEIAAISKARVILRDPNGPWRHGPVYVAIMDRFSRIITLHGGFPDRFEFRRGGIATDIATGELVVDQLVRAAESGPDGDFWLYYFDNPDDDTDSADVPKVGYARVFPARLPRPDGRIVEIDYIVNSGFYLTSDGEFVQRILEALHDGQESMMFSITSHEDGDVVVGDDVAVSVIGAPTDTVHFAYRPAGMPEEGFTYLGAATNRDDGASFDWDTLDLPDDAYELVALYTEDEGYSVIYDSIEVNVDNVGGGGGGCAAAPVLPGGGGPPDVMLPGLLAVAAAYLLSGAPPPAAAAGGGVRRFGGRDGGTGLGGQGRFDTRSRGQFRHCPQLLWNCERLMSRATKVVDAPPSPPMPFQHDSLMSPHRQFEDSEAEGPVPHTQGESRH